MVDKRYTSDLTIVYYNKRKKCVETASAAQTFSGKIVQFSVFAGISSPDLAVFTWDANNKKAIMRSKSHLYLECCFRNYERGVISKWERHYKCGYYAPDAIAARQEAKAATKTEAEKYAKLKRCLNCKHAELYKKPSHMRNKYAMCDLSDQAVEKANNKLKELGLLIPGIEVSTIYVRQDEGQNCPFFERK